MTYVPGQPPRLRFAPREAQYALYAKGAVVPEFTLVLLKDQPIGFERTSNGTLLGVAGEYKQPLRSRRYRWIELNFANGQGNNNTSEAVAGAGVLLDIGEHLTAFESTNEWDDRTARATLDPSHRDD